MAQDSLSSFSNQIAEWITGLLEHGRFPFRKVAQSPEIVTPEGTIKPDLVLWINEPSCMAGGVLFMPQKEAAHLYSAYAATASSLGLKHFTVWGSRAIEICAIEPPYRTQTRLEIQDTSSSDDFRHSLRELLERLKPLAVTGAIPPYQLSSWHLVNLCLMTLKESQPAILESLRGHRNAHPQLSPESLAEEHGWHTLFQLLSLVSFDLLPETVHAERMERALEIATEALPEHLQKGCQSLEQTKLPEAASIAFHHLFRRLTQVGWRNDSKRMQDTLKSLLEQSANSFTRKMPRLKAEHPILCNPLFLDHPGRCSLLSSPGRLPGLLLERELQKLPAPVFACPSPFHLPLGQEPLFDEVRGGFCDNAYWVKGSIEDSFSHIRASWPNRRFQFPRRPSFWAMELLHLLGNCQMDARIDLDTPPDWPRDPGSRFLSKILAESFAIDELTQNPESLGITLRRAHSEEAFSVRLKTGEIRHVETEWLSDSPDTALATTLNLPHDMWALLRRGELDFRDVASIAPKAYPGVLRFGESSFGKTLMIRSGIKFPKKLSQESFLELAGYFPLPPVALLEQLSSDEYLQASTERLERDIEQWLGIQAPDIEDFTPAHDTAARRLRQKEKQRLLDTVFIDGIPAFPGHYLYDHYQPETRTFDLPGPLVFQRRFFNQIELANREGELVVADNDLIAHALILTSHCGLQTVDLPVEEDVLSDIMQRYLDDLVALKEALIEQCNRSSETSEKARALARKLWRKQNLPPWEFLERNF